MSSYEGIFIRRSVRKYRMEPLDTGLLEALKRFLKNAAPLDSQSRVSFEIIDNLKQKEKVKGLWKAEAPYYLAVYCESGSAACRNAGYLSEQAVLYLTSREVATCYLGETKVGEPQKDGLKRLLVIAFGRAEGKNGTEKPAVRRRTKRVGRRDMCSARWSARAFMSPAARRPCFPRCAWGFCPQRRRV